MTEGKRKLFITLGIILAITPFLGIPSSWRIFVYVVLGLWIAVTSFLINRDFSIFKKESNSAEEKIKKTEGKEEKSFSDGLGETGWKKTDNE